MLIIWGKKAVYRKLGYVADFCPICRAPEAFELKRVGIAGHVYYMTLGEGELVGYERTCQKCDTAFKADYARYASVARSPAPLAELTQQTFPDFEKVLGERLALEARIQRDPSSLTPETRHALIRTPFLLLSPKVERRFASTRVDWRVGLTIIAAMWLVLIGSQLVQAVAPSAGGMAFLASVAIGLFLVFWQISESGRRFMGNQVIPVLASSLRPLGPTERELTVVLGELKQSSPKMGKRLKLADLQAQLARATGSAQAG